MRRITHSTLELTVRDIAKPDLALIRVPVKPEKKAIGHSTHELTNHDIAEADLAHTFSGKPREENDSALDTFLEHLYLISFPTRCPKVMILVPPSGLAGPQMALKICQVASIASNFWGALTIFVFQKQLCIHEAA